MNNDDLLKYLNSSNGLITTKALLELGISKYKLNNLVSSGILSKVSHGLYSSCHDDIDEYFYFSHRLQKAVFSHETSSYLNGLTTRYPLVYIMTTYSGDNVSRITKSSDDLIIYYKNKKFLNTGLIDIVSPFGNSIKIYDKERTVLDFIKDRHKIDPEVFTQTLQNYFSSSDRDLNKLYKYASLLGLEDKLRIYTEVLV